MLVLNLPFKALRSEERFSRNAETDLVCRLLLEKKNGGGKRRQQHGHQRKRAEQPAGTVGQAVQCRQFRARARGPARSTLFPYTTLFRSAASGGIQGDVLATDNNTVGMGDAGIKSAIQGSNVPNPDEAVPSFVSGAMAKAGKGLLEGTLQAGTSAVSDKLLD